MAIWEVRIWFAQCVRCRFRAHQEGGYRKGFVHTLRSDGWYIQDRKTLCPRCRERQNIPKQEVNG
jgi:hypothetical protein